MHILHIGTGKTGSTAIQRALAQNLPSGSYVYCLNSEVHHNSLELAIKKPRDWHRVNRKIFANNPGEGVAQARFLAKKMRSEIENGNINIVSSEYLFSLRPDEIVTLLDLLKCPAEDARVIAYVRRPSSYVLSALQQYLKHAWDISGEMVKKYRVKDGILNWISVVGFENLWVRSFEDGQYHARGVVGDFLDVVAELGGERICGDVEQRRVNTSLSAESCICLQNIKREMLQVEPHNSNELNEYINRAVARCAKNIEGTPLSFRSGVAEIIDANHEEEIRFLRNNYAIDYSSTSGEIEGSPVRDSWFLAASAEVSDLVNFDGEQVAALIKEVREVLRST